MALVPDGLLSKITIGTGIRTDFLDQVIEAIFEICQYGYIGDSKICLFVISLILFIFA